MKSVLKRFLFYILHSSHTKNYYTMNVNHTRCAFNFMDYSKMIIEILLDVDWLHVNGDISVHNFWVAHYSCFNLSCGKKEVHVTCEGIVVPLQITEQRINIKYCFLAKFGQKCQWMHWISQQVYDDEALYYSCTFKWFRRHFQDNWESAENYLNDRYLCRKWFHSTTLHILWI